jgi:hypothetical protein
MTRTARLLPHFSSQSVPAVAARIWICRLPSSPRAWRHKGNDVPRRERVKSFGVPAWSVPSSVLVAVLQRDLSEAFTCIRGPLSEGVLSR